MKLIKLNVIFFVLMLSACANSNMTANNKQVRQGVTGQVLWLEGNLMPGPGRNTTQGEPVVREIYFYNPVKMKDLKGSGNLYEEVPGEAVAVATSDTEGNFSVKLKPGQYSVFTKEPQGYFASSFNGEGVVNPVKVQENEITEMNIKINYKAVY